MYFLASFLGELEVEMVRRQQIQLRNVDMKPDTHTSEHEMRVRGETCMSESTTRMFQMHVLIELSTKYFLFLVFYI